MNWETYENIVFENCKRYFREATIEKNIKITGRYSNRKRQIDILITQYIAGNKIAIIVDCKFYKKKIDVKQVESFIAMMDDVAADKGLMVTEKGYTKSAINRAYNNPRYLELDIYTLAEVKSRFHSEIAIPFSGKNYVLIMAPFGWIVDGTSRPGSVCMLYQRGLTMEEAAIRRELAYINFWDRKKDNITLKDLIDFQEDSMRKELTVKNIKYRDTIKRNDASTIIRIADIKGYPGIEITGFIEFKYFIFFCVWFSPSTLIPRNINKLESLMKYTVPIRLRNK
jgi:hypothetical protein